jgi:hypothetical protein
MKVQLALKPDDLTILTDLYGRTKSGLLKAPIEYQPIEGGVLVFSRDKDNDRFPIVFKVNDDTSLKVPVKSDTDMQELKSIIGREFVTAA